MAEEAEVFSQVFDNELLREHILGYTIREAGNNLCRQTLCTVRFIKKSWKLSVSALLRKNNEALYKLVLNENNSLSGTRYVQERGKILEEFLNFIRSRNETFSLFIKPEFFRLENHQSFLAVLRQASEKIVELDMLIPVNCGSLPCVFSNVNLPNLKKLNFDLSQDVLSNVENENGCFQHPTNYILLLLTIFNGNKSLKNFRIQHKVESLPGIEYIFLPATITQLHMDCSLTDREMEILVHHQLPSLTSLLFCVGNRALPDELIFKILNNFRKTLKSLCIKMQSVSRPPITANNVNFPVMEKLENLEVVSMHIVLDPKIQNRLENCLPKLKSLKLAFQTEENFKRWIKNSSLKSVNSLTLQLVDYTQFFEHPGRVCVLPSSETMQRVGQQMPNICNLSLIFEPENAPGLSDLLKEITHLSSLTLFMESSNMVVNSDLWDSLLTGIPIENVRMLRSNPSYLETFDINIIDRPSIRLLKRLSQLSIMMPEMFTEQRSSFGLADSLLSPLSFKFAFNQMENLKLLNLGGKFRVSDQDTQEWKNQGRTIVYI